MLQNIDPILLLQPIIVIVFSVATVLYWRLRQGFTRDALGFSLVAYGGAIAVKFAFQYLTAPSFMAAAQGSLWLLGLYLGLQTVIFEVGGAFLVARFAVSHRRMKKNEGVAYGLGLAFWENCALIGATSLLSLIFYWITLAQGGVAAESLYSLLSTSQPQLFYPPLDALQAVGWGLLERISSLMVHLSWGYLCLKSAASRKNVYFLLALPMGMVDFLVPFVQIITVPTFEMVVFMLAALCILATVCCSRR
jgi:uncharacterized membrane protein YhfC